jgi:ribonuclease PH
MSALISQRYDRGPLSLRQLGCVLGPISEAEGSCRFTMGDTMVVASVYGPGEPKYLRHEDYSSLTIDVLFSTSLGGGTGGGGGGAGGADAQSGVPSSSHSEALQPSNEQQRLERQGSRIIQHVFEQAIDCRRFPRQLLSIRITVLHNGGAVIAAAVTAASLALVNAGVPMLYLPLSVSAVLLPSVTSTAARREGSGAQAEPQWLLDPTTSEEKMAKSTHTYVCKVAVAGGGNDDDNDDVSMASSANSTSTIVHGFSAGSFLPAEMAAGQGLCTQGCAQVMRFVRSCVKQAAGPGR